MLRRKGTKLAKIKGLRWAPTTKLGMLHGIDKLRRKARKCSDIAELLKIPKFQTELANGKIPPELKNIPSFMDLRVAKIKEQKGRNPTEMNKVAQFYADQAREYGKSAETLFKALMAKREKQQGQSK